MPWKGHCNGILGKPHARIAFGFPVCAFWGTRTDRIADFVGFCAFRYVNQNATLLYKPLDFPAYLCYNCKKVCFTAKKICGLPYGGEGL